MPSEQFQTVLCHLTISDSGQRGRTLNAPAFLPVFKCIAPAKAIMAPLSSSMPSAENTMTFRTDVSLAFGVGTCTVMLRKFHGVCGLHRPSIRTTTDLNPVCNRRFTLSPPTHRLPHLETQGRCRCVSAQECSSAPLSARTCSTAVKTAVFKPKTHLQIVGMNHRARKTNALHLLLIPQVPTVSAPP